MNTKPNYRLPNSKRNTAAGIASTSIGAAVVYFLICLWATTQYTAHQLDYQAALGVPLGWGIYEPWMYFVWQWKFGGVVGTEALWDKTNHFIFYAAHGIFPVAIFVAVIRARRLSGKTDTHGSAHWATPKEIKATGLLAESRGVYVGAWTNKKGYVHYLRHDGPEHVLAFAPSRSGKGVGLVIPTLLAWPHSVVVHDIKGENWALTAGWRQREIGSHVLKFDPTCADGTGARFNPLMEVRRGHWEVRDAQNIADILIDPTGEAEANHWNQTAHDLLTAVILHTLYTSREKSLAGCLLLLADPVRPIHDTLGFMLAGGHPTVAAVARSLLNKSEDERSGIVSTAIRALALWRDPVIAANTAASDFRLADLMHADRPVSLYLTVPPADLSRTRALMRLLLSQLVRRLTERMDFADGGPTAHYKHRLLLMLDEFAALGRLDFLQSALGYLAGYGVKAFLIAQDLAQIYQRYTTHESIVSGCTVRIAFAPNKPETAKLLSDMAGQMTVFKETRTYTGSRLQPVLMHVIAAESETKRPLLT
nr:type IV secretory system conjugative DNA transfer family protein [Pseudomonadota bacterium]